MCVRVRVLVQNHTLYQVPRVWFALTHGRSTAQQKRSVAERMANRFKELDLRFDIFPVRFGLGAIVQEFAHFVDVFFDEMLGSNVRDGVEFFITNATNVTCDAYQRQGKMNLVQVACWMTDTESRFREETLERAYLFEGGMRSHSHH